MSTAATPASRAASCLSNSLNAEGRLRETLKKRGPTGETLRRSRLITAMDEIAEQIQQHHCRTWSPQRRDLCRVLSGTKIPPRCMWRKPGIKRVGSPSPTTRPSPLTNPSRKIAQSQFGTWAGGTHAFTGADVCMMIGNNPVVSMYTQFGGPPPFSPYARIRDEMKRGMKVIVADPRQSEVANRATLHLQVRPGEDPTLLSAMIRYIVQENLHDAAFCTEHVDNLASCRPWLSLSPPTTLPSVAGFQRRISFEPLRFSVKPNVGLQSAAPVPTCRRGLSSQCI